MSASDSPRDIVRAGIIVIASMSFLLGVFLMLGLQKFLQHDALYILFLLILPLLLVAATLHVRRIWKVIP